MAEGILPVFRNWAGKIAHKLEVGKDVLLQFDLARRVSPAESRSLVKIPGRTMVHHCSQYPGALVVTGGDTARAVLNEWGIRRLDLIGEVEPGLPYSVAEGWSRKIPILTKAGAFGTPSSLLHCREFLGELKRAPSQVNSDIQSTITENAHMKPIIAITMGDAAGVGPEVIIKSLAHPEVYAQCRRRIGDAQRLKEAARITRSVLSVRSFSDDEIEAAEFQLGVVDCVDLKLIPSGLPWGRLSAPAGDAAYQYLAVAARLALAGKVCGDLYRAFEQGGAAGCGAQVPGTHRAFGSSDRNARGVDDAHDSQDEGSSRHYPHWPH